jgi:Class-II DAHP synthetase family
VPQTIFIAWVSCAPGCLFSGQLRRCNPPLQTVTWVCDPMHGNTETVSNYKTRRYENIRAEVWVLCWQSLLTLDLRVQARV